METAKTRKHLLSGLGKFVKALNRAARAAVNRIKKLKSRARYNTMALIKHTLPFLDDIFLTLGLITFVAASYLVNAVLGTYVLGIAFLVAAFFVGTALRSPAVQQAIGKFQRKK
jgi:hypothetical protein